MRKLVIEADVEHVVNTYLDQFETTRYRYEIDGASVTLQTKRFDNGGAPLQSARGANGLGRDQEGRRHGDRRQIGSSIGFGRHAQQDVGHEGSPNRPSRVLGRLRWRMAGVRTSAVSAVRGNF
jgi:hypothetical protein